MHSRFYYLFFNDTATAEIYTLSLHDALPIFQSFVAPSPGLTKFRQINRHDLETAEHGDGSVDRKSTRLNSSHTVISYAVFCLKKKKYGVLFPPLGLLPNPPGRCVTDS